MRKIIVFELILFILFLSHPVSAEAPDFGALMVKKGLDMFGKSIGDSFYELGDVNSSGPVNQTNSSTMLVKVVSFTIDPYSLGFVKEWILISIVGYVFIAIISLCIDIVMFSHGSISYREMSENVLFSGVVPAATLFLNYILLLISTVVSAFIAGFGLTLYPVSDKNITAYIIMGLVFLILSIIMLARNIVIIFYTATCLILASLYRLPHMKEFVWAVSKRYIAIVFLQPYLLLLMVLGIAFLQLLPQLGFGGNWQALGSVVLGIYIVYQAVTTISGSGLIKIFIYRAVFRGVIKR